MSNVNMVTIGGNLCSNPKVFDFDGGKRGLAITIANNVYAGVDNDEQVNYIDCMLIGKARVDAMEKILEKGMHVVVSGTLRQRQCKDGQYRLSVRVRDLELMSKREDGDRDEREPEVDREYRRR